MTKRALKLLKATKKRAAPRSKPGAIPAAPAYLGARARELWDSVANPLFEAGLLTELTAPALAELVSTWSMVLVLRADVEEHGTTQTTTTKAGGVLERARPAATQLDSAEKRLFVRLQAFGLTPAALRSVTVAHTTKSDDPTSAYL